MNIETLVRICTSSTHPVTAQHRTVLNRYVEPLTRLMKEYQIDTPIRQAHFLAQITHESGEFRNTEENLKYSATRLLEIFPKYFKSQEAAKAAAYNPEIIANTVYANRMGNGTPQSGDGYRFRGRGLIQTTGKNNYAKFLSHLLSISSESLDPKTIAAIHSAFPLAELAPLIATPELAVRSACFYWQCNHLNQLADQGCSAQVVEAITRRINGGTTGLSFRKAYFYRAQLALKVK